MVKYFEQAINALVKHCGAEETANGWRHDPATGEELTHNLDRSICLIHNEVSEAYEGIRKDKMDDHLPHRKAVEVELADALHRVFNFADREGLDLGGALMEKIEYNRTRADFKAENRTKPGGKKF